MYLCSPTFIEILLKNSFVKVFFYKVWSRDCFHFAILNAWNAWNYF